MSNFLIFLLFIFPIACSGYLLLVSSSKKFSNLGLYLSPLFSILSITIVFFIWLKKNFDFSASYNWFRVFDFYSDWSIKLDILSLSMITMIYIVSLCVQLCSLWYIKKEKTKFLIYVNLFSFFMILLVSSCNLLQLFLCWEAVGLFSYLLIGFYYYKDSSSIAGFKSFIINRFGDLFFILGIALFYKEFNTLDCTGLPYIVESNALFNVFSFKFSSIDVICTFFLIGCFTKSAQIFFHGWLIDAMEGPTPSSALIHAATMVTAGVFFIVRCCALYNLSDFSSNLLLIIGSSTALMFSFAAIFQTDIKKIVAYSTCSQLGFMFVIVGLRFYDTAMFYLFTHSFFKALMFLCVGIAVKYNNNNKDINSFAYSSISPFFAKFCASLACFSLVGLFPFSGYYSKSLIFEHLYAFDNENKFGKALFFMIFLSSIFTSIYSMRLLSRCFFPKRRLSAKKSYEGILNFMAVTPLSLLSCGFGYVGINFLKIAGDSSYSFWGQNSVIASSDAIKKASDANHYISYVIFFVSILSFYLFRNLKITFNNRAKNYLEQKWFSSYFYNYLSLLFCCLCNITYKFFDSKILNKVFSFIFPKVINKSCSISTFLHSSSMINSMLFMFVGLLILIGWTFLFV